MAHLLLNVLLAALAGSCIGLERTYHGRVAGFRTHGIVALAAALAISIAHAPLASPGLFPPEVTYFDPTRLAQGVMTGVGFLGAGVIFKEGLSIQGLTTAASVWATAAIGLVFGLGLYPVGLLGVGLALTSLVLLRWVEGRIPTRTYAVGLFRFDAASAPDEAGLRRLLGEGVWAEDVSHALTDRGALFEYRANLQVRTDPALDALAQRLRRAPELLEFDLSRISK